MKKLKDFLAERFVNLFDNENDRLKRETYAEVIFDMINKAYESQGGIKGNGFKSHEDMIKNIPFWKIGIRDTKVVCVALYKDKNGRKRVAIASNGTPEGKKTLADIIINDLKQARSYMEISGKSLIFLKKQIDITKYIIPYDKAIEILKDNGDNAKKPLSTDPEVKAHPELKDYFYTRKINNELHTKIMLGTIGKNIINYED